MRRHGFFVRLTTLSTLLLLVGVIGSFAYIWYSSQSTNFAATTDSSNFQLTINPGPLSVAIVDAGHSVVPSPNVVMSSSTSAFSCQSSSGIFGTSGERLYVANPDAADNGWTLTMAATLGATSVWSDGGSKSFDYNDPTGSGCTDGGDADSVGGQMTINPSVSTVVNGLCSSCSTTGVSKGSAASFSQGVTDSITLLSAAAGSDDVADFDITGLGVSQTIPSSQGAASYNSDFTITVTAS